MILNYFQVGLIPQVCSLRKAKMYASIGVAQEKATPAYQRLAGRQT